MSTNKKFVCIVYRDILILLKNGKRYIRKFCFFGFVAKAYCLRWTDFVRKWKTRHVESHRTPDHIALTPFLEDVEMVCGCFGICHCRGKLVVFPGLLSVRSLRENDQTGECGYFTSYFFVFRRATSGIGWTNRSPLLGGNQSSGG